MQMDAKEYLGQVKKLDKMINEKLKDKDKWVSLAKNISVGTEGERVQSSGSQQRMADAVCSYIDIEKEIDKCIDLYTTVKKEVISLINGLPRIERTVLYQVYIKYLPLYKVAEKYGKSYSWAKKLHARATSKVQVILDRRSEKK